MRIFKLAPKIEVVCESQKTRSGFRHVATLFVDGQEHSKDKCCYQNRSWESYEFQSVLHRIIERSGLSVDDKAVCKKVINKDQSDDSPLRTVAGIAKLAEVFCDGQKEKNDWKLRMLKAGLQSSGLSIPDDWESLTEEQKEVRLNNVIKFAGEQHANE